MRDSRVPFRSSSVYERYEFLDVLGQGGMAIVFKAYDATLDRPVAIKTLSAYGISQTDRAALSQEARLQAKLNHPNIVTLYSLIEDDAALGLVLEYVEGRTLAEVIVLRQTRMQEKLEWLLQIINGLDHAHENGVIHCDLKPDNILIGADGFAKIFDFGIALFNQNQSNHTDQSTDWGSRLYASPEQLTGGALSYRSDYFSLGILAHTLISNSHPFGDSVQRKAVGHNIINNSQARLSELVPERLRQSLIHLMDKNAFRRDGALGELKSAVTAELRATTGLEGIVTDPTLKLAPTKRPVRYFPLAASVAVMFLAGFYFYSLNYQQPLRDYVAIAPLDVSVQFENLGHWRTANAVDRTLHEFVRSNPSLALAANEFAAQSSSIKELVSTSGADFLLVARPQCSDQYCEIVLQKVSSVSQEVKQEQRYQVLTESMDSVRQSTLKAAYSLWEQEPTQRIIDAIEPLAFEDYLKMYDKTKGGTEVSIEDLEKIEELITNSPEFLPLYKLHSLGTKHLWEQSGETTFLTRSERLIVNHAQALIGSSELESLRIQSLILQGQFDQAETRLKSFPAIAQDKIQINDLASYLAFERGNYKRALEIDQENATLQPSVWRWYNLALSQYSTGELEQAGKSVKQALLLFPQHTYALDFKAVLAMLMGELDESFRIYSTMDIQTMDVDALSNFSYLQLMLGEASASIKTISRAIDKNSSVATFYLNRGDAYLINGENELANADYQNAIVLSASSDSAESLSVQAQSYAHIGNEAEALRIIEKAKRAHPDAANVSYAAAIVQTVAGNLPMALVEIERVLELGYPPSWLDVPWFEPLCTKAGYVERVLPTRTCAGS